MTGKAQAEARGSSICGGHLFYLSLVVFNMTVLCDARKQHKCTRTPVCPQDNVQ